MVCAELDKSGCYALVEKIDSEAATLLSNIGMFPTKLSIGCRVAYALYPGLPLMLQ